MMKEKFKYTADGKKVVVIGDLNQTEKIVQEIYVTEDGCEIPQGERFVVKSLLDAPAKPWKEKELERLESEYEKTSKYWETKMRQLITDKESAYKALTARVRWLRNVAKEPQMKSLSNILNTIADFMDGSEKWILVNEWCGFVLEKFDDNGVSRIMDKFERGQYDSMRLLSLFGKSDGSFDFKINNYSDGSGSDKKVLFFKSKGEALAFMQAKFDNKSDYNSSDIEQLTKYELHIDTEKYNRYQTRLINDSFNRVEKLKVELENAQKSYDELKNTLK